MGNSSLGLALRNAVSGMQATQTAIETVSNNIANARNPDYHRQKVNLASRSILGTGSGVRVESVTRVVDRFLTADLIQNHSQRAQSEVLERFFDQMQNLFGTVASDNSIGRRITKIADTLESLSNTPSGLSEQSNVLSAIESFVDHLSQLSKNIQGLREEADQRIGDSVQTINEQSILIRKLNTDIARALGTGQQAGALEDERDAAVAKIAEQIDITTFERPANHELVVLTRSGRALADYGATPLDHRSAAQLSSEITHSGGDVSGIILNGEDITNHIKGGRLGALIAMRDTILPDLGAAIGQLSSTLSEQLNAAANTGSSFPPPQQLVGSRRFNTNDIIGTTESVSGTLRLAVLDRDGDYVDSGFGRADILDLDLKSLALAQGGVLTVGSVVEAIDNGLSSASAYLDSRGRLVIETLESGHGVAIDAVGRSLGGSGVGVIQQVMSTSVDAARDTLNVSFGAESGTHILEIDNVPVSYNVSRDSLVDLAARINRTQALRSLNRVSNPLTNLNTETGSPTGATIGAGRFTVDGVAFAYDGQVDSLNTVRDRINSAAVWQSLAFADPNAQLGAASAGNLVINGQTVVVNANTSLNDLAAAINGDPNFATAGVSASVISEEGQSRLVISDTGGAFDLTGSDANVLTNLGFSIRPFVVTATTTGGDLTFSRSDGDPPIVADVTGGLMGALNMVALEFPVNASVVDNQLVLTKESTELIEVRDISGNLVASMNLQSKERPVLQTESRINLAGRSRNFSHFFGFNDILLSQNDYATYASGVFDDARNRPGAEGSLTFLADGLRANVTYKASDQLTDIVDSINNNLMLRRQGIQASLFQEGSGVRVRISNEGGRNFLLEDNGLLLDRLNLRTDNTLILQTIRVNERLVEDVSRMPRGTFSPVRTPPTQIDGVQDSFANAGIRFTYDPVQSRSGDAYRLSYDASDGEVMTIVNLTTGQQQSVDITGPLNSVTRTVGGSLVNEETASISFDELGILVTLDADFDRNADRITTGNRAAFVGLASGGVALVREAMFQPSEDEGFNLNGLRELREIGSYSPIDGSLTLNFNSPQAGVLNLVESPGLEFSVDNGPFAAVPGQDLDDGGSHSVTIRLAESHQILGVLTLPELRGNGGPGELSIQFGESVFGQSRTPKIGENALAGGDSSVVRSMLVGFDSNIEFQRAGGLPSESNTLGGYAADIVGLNSIKAQTARADRASQEAVHNTLESQKGEISGVNVNEELAQLEILRTAFNAASRLIRVSADLLDELINIVR